MHLKRYFLSLVFFTSSCTLSHKQEITECVEPAKKKKPAYFITTPITKRSPIQSPCLDICIQGQTFSVELDLGYRGNLTFIKQATDTIISKVFFRETPMYGIRGKEYVTKLYQIPALEIGKMTFTGPIIQEEGEDFLKDATFVQEGKERSPRDPGRLGWELFYNVNLLIDLEHSLIAFCDSLENLATQGYEIESFTSTPLFLERGLIEFDAQTPEGVLRCMLDTGATQNMFNSKFAENQSLDEAMWDDTNLFQYSSLRIGDNEFGPIVFRRIPIKIPIRIEAVLGIEFFEDNLVFLDFSGKTAYFYKRPIAEPRETNTIL